MPNKPKARTRSIDSISSASSGEEESAFLGPSHEDERSDSDSDSEYESDDGYAAEEAKLPRPSIHGHIDTLVTNIVAHEGSGISCAAAIDSALRNVHFPVTEGLGRYVHKSHTFEFSNNHKKLDFLALVRDAQFLCGLDPDNIEIFNVAVTGVSNLSSESPIALEVSLSSGGRRVRSTNASIITMNSDGKYKNNQSSLLLSRESNDVTVLLAPQKATGMNVLTVLPGLTVENMMEDVTKTKGAHFHLITPQEDVDKHMMMLALRAGDLGEPKISKPDSDGLVTIKIPNELVNSMVEHVGTAKILQKTSTRITDLNVQVACADKGEWSVNVTMDFFFGAPAEPIE
ncbi:MAG: hypothetical protein ACTSUE_27025 [Promethearchaeota archaeon]